MIDFINYLNAKGFSKNTVESYVRDINLYVIFCNKMGIEIYSKNSIYKYFSYLKSKKLQESSLKRKKASLLAFSKFLSVQGKEKILDSDTVRFKDKKKLPSYLKTKEVRAILDSFNVKEDLEYRDFFIVFFLFSTGIRVSELINIMSSDIDINERIVKIRGKGNKERLVVLTESLASEYQIYYDRFKYIIDKIGYLFFNNRGKKFTRRGVEFIFERIYKNNSNALSYKKFHPHVLRHSYATALIENGADIRYVAETMGHASLDTTEKYTHVSIKKLRDAYMYHPHA